MNKLRVYGEVRALQGNPLQGSKDGWHWLYTSNHRQVIGCLDWISVFVPGPTIKGSSQGMQPCILCCGLGEV
jgi:hypothetical protein